MAFKQDDRNQQLRADARRAESQPRARFTRPGSLGASRARRGKQRGQTIVIALLVLMLLAFAGALFVTIIARNLTNAGRQNRTEVSNYYAEAGLRFADDQLTHSADGADWRPPLQCVLAISATAQWTARANNRYAQFKASNANFVAVNSNDPDKAYLEQGFTRYNFGDGRFLIRLTYDPMVDQSVSGPAGRYIKIEAVGREGNVDPTDPTTYRNAPPIRQNSTLVAFKAIGITDYARFITNPDKRNDVWNLGVPSTYDTSNKKIVSPGVWDFATGGTATLKQFPVITQYGAPDAYYVNGNEIIPNPLPNSGLSLGPSWRKQPGGGSLRVNGSVRLFGLNNVYLPDPNVLPPAILDLAPAYSDKWEISGVLYQDNYNKTEYLDGDTRAPGGKGGSQNAGIVLNPTDPNDPTTGVQPPVGPSGYVDPVNPTGFDTKHGIFRDGARGNDSNGFPRDISRLDPPDILANNPITNLPRYKDIAMNSPPRNNPTVSGTYPAYPSNSAQFGYGQAIYIDNLSDVQNESADINGGYTLIDDWLNRVAPANNPGNKYGWTANIYTPPAVNIVIGKQAYPYAITGGPTSNTYGIRIERSDTRHFKSPTGVDLAAPEPDGTTSTSMTVNYSDLGSPGDIGASNNPDSAGGTTVSNPNNDVLIYAEGNVRVSGIASADINDASTTTTEQYPRHITIVTNATAYIDGNLLKGNPESSITILARDYVCVNTTQFFVGADVDNTAHSPGISEYSALRALDFDTTLNPVLKQQFTYGLPSISSFFGGTGTPGTPQKRYYLPGGPPPDEFLYLSAGPSSPGVANGSFAFNNLTFGALPPITQAFPSFMKTTIDVGALNSQIEGQFATMSTSSLGPQDLVLERAAVLPMDVRIEAVLYAQNKSFFVIPGEWFNTSQADNTNAYLTATLTPGGRWQRPTVNNDLSREARFPFYGQPIDLRITVSGAVSEGYPAPISAQSAWMLKWGWIPHYHGSVFPGAAGDGMVSEYNGHSAGVSTPFPDTGLALIYDPVAGYPYTVVNPNAAVLDKEYLRLDEFGRPLPFAPKLPVCAGLLYSGQSGQQPLFQ